MVRSQGTSPLRFLYSGKRLSFQYNGRASGLRIYLDTEAMSRSDINIVRLVVAKHYHDASTYQTQFFFYTVRLVLSF